MNIFFSNTGMADQEEMYNEQNAVKPVPSLRCLMKTLFWKTQPYKFASGVEIAIMPQDQDNSYQTIGRWSMPWLQRLISPTKCLKNSQNATYKTKPIPASRPLSSNINAHIYLYLYTRELTHTRFYRFSGSSYSSCSSSCSLSFYSVNVLAC